MFSAGLAIFLMTAVILALTATVLKGTIWLEPILSEQKGRSHSRKLKPIRVSLQNNIFKEYSHTFVA